MKDHHPFWSLGLLSDAALVGGLAELVGSGRQVMARLIAHLAEVEHRRLHLDGGFGSMFSYCVGRLGLSEDEACRRIEVARLARQYPAIYPRLAAGQLSLSVIVLLKPYLSASTAMELLDLVAGNSVAKAKELLASRFPRPDVASVIRKLPERPTLRAALRDESAKSLGVTLQDGKDLDLLKPPSQTAMSTTAESQPQLPSAMQLSSGRDAAQPGNRFRPSAGGRPIVEPLSKARYKIQFTADTELKEKLELARDLMRHTQPDGDLAPILNRALDLLLEQIMKRRFGARGAGSALARVDGPAASAPTSNPLNSDNLPATPSEGQSTARPSTRVPPAAVRPAPDRLVSTPPAPVPTVAVSTAAAPKAAMSRAATPPAASTAVIPKTVLPAAAMPPAAIPPAATPPAAIPKAAVQTALSPKHPPACIPRATRRIVVERDGLRCTWQGPDGTRCNARAWLELDHRHGRARGGDATAENIRVLCRAHNQRAAEHEYGRRHIEDCIRRSRSKDDARDDSRRGGPPD